MNNADYWAQRMKNMTDALEDKSYEYVKNLEEQFDRAISEVEKDIAYWYQRFADNNEIDLAEAKKLLSKGELKELKWSVEEYIKYGEENAINEQWMSELENASAKAHISRLDGLKLQLTQQAEKLSHLTEKATESAGKGIYEDCYYRTAFELQQQIGVGTVMGGIDERQIEKVLSRPWTTDNQTFRDRCWTNKTALVNSVNRELTQMIMRGEKPDRTINAIAKQFDVAKSKAGRLVMTESAFFAQQSQKDCFNELDVEKCKVVAALDKHTCSICGKLDGTIIKMSDYEVGSTAPPFHPWCRCTTAPYFEDMEGIGERYARDVETGESFTVPKDMTYEQWKNIYVNKTATISDWQTNHNYQSRIVFDFNGNDEKFAQSRTWIERLDGEYKTRLERVTVGAKQAAGDVTMSGERMRLNNASVSTAFHEFAHTIANSKADKYGLTQDGEFWKEIKRIQRKYRKVVGDDSSKWISWYEHASISVDEFFAEAFTQAKMREYGLALPSNYGNDFTYSQQVLDVTNRYFKKSIDNITIDNTKNKSIIGQADKLFSLKRSEDFKTVWLPGNEYSHVMSEIASNLSKEEAAARVFSKPIGDFVYTVENNGFCNYRLISKRIIK